MISSDFRADARRKLIGKWKPAVLITLAYCFVFFAIGFVGGLLPESLKGLVSIAELVIQVPLILGLFSSYLKLYNGEEVKAFDFWTVAFANFGKSWSVFGNTLLKMIVPIILIIVSYVVIFIGLFSALGSGLYAYSASSRAALITSGSFGFVAILGFILLFASMIWTFMKSFYYQLAYLVAVDNPEMSGKEAVAKSEELMKNKRGKLFCLQLSFIGWAILAAFTLGIGYLWLMPYIQVALVSFYKNTLNNEDVVVEEK